MRWNLIPAINWRKVRLPFMEPPLEQFEEEFGLKSSQPRITFHDTDTDKEMTQPLLDAAIKPQQSPFSKLLVSMLVLVALTIFFVVLIREYMADVLGWLESLPEWQGAIFFCLLFLAVSLPMTWGYIVLNIAAGYLYGLVDGVIITSIGASFGGLIAFIACRRLAKNYVLSLLSAYDNLKQIVRVIEGRQGFRIIMMTRLTPIPYGLQNALFSTAKISKRRYFFATLFGLLPTQILNTYMGTTLRSMEDVLSGGSSNSLVLIGQIAVAVAVTLMVNARMKKEVHLACEREAELSSLAEKKDLSPTASSPIVATLIHRHNSENRFARWSSDVSTGHEEMRTILPVLERNSSFGSVDEVVINISPLPDMDGNLSPLDADVSNDLSASRLTVVSDGDGENSQLTALPETHLTLNANRGHRRSMSAGPILGDSQQGSASKPSPLRSSFKIARGSK